MNFESKRVDYVNETMLGKFENQLIEKTIVNPKDKKRLLKLIKDYGKIIYNDKIYTVVVSTTGKFIKGQGLEIESDKIKSYQIDSTQKAIILEK